MSDIKYRINLGNCETDVFSNLTPPSISAPLSIKWDSTQYSFDDTIITFDYT